MISSRLFAPRLGGAVLALALLSSAPAQKSPLANVTVLIIRHGEKPESGTGLTPQGERRAQALIGFFNGYEVDGKRAVPDYLFATKDTKKSHRETLTLAPLAKALGLKMDDRFKNDDVEALADDLRAKHYGKRVLICWHHGHIPALVTALGFDAGKLIPGAKWPNETFDWVIQLPFDSQGHPLVAAAKRLPQPFKVTE